MLENYQMKNSIIVIPIINLILCLIPCAIVISIMYKWTKDIKNYVYGFLRMISQLLLLGYILAFIFNAEKYWIVILCLCFMSSVASWISLNPVKDKRKNLFLFSCISIFIAGSTILILITQFVLKINPWFSPKEMIPLGGMIFSAGMNSISLASDRFFSEIKKGETYLNARATAFKTSLIPVTNMLFAVGLVSIPGVMTGQILSGVSPLIAVRYQIMILAMIFSSGGLSSAIFLTLIRKNERF